MSDQSLPAIVVKFDRTKNIATVKPLIKWVDISDKQYSRHQISGLNVLSLGGGGFHVSFPLKEGDLGWIVAADRDISLFKQSLKEAAPNTGRIHDFSDGWFVPDVFRKYVINQEDSESMVIQSTDAKTRIAISNGTVVITAPTSLKVDSPTSTFTGDVIVKKNVTVEGNQHVNGTLEIDGMTTASGGLDVHQSCTLPSGTTVGGINVSTHGHISNKPGLRTIGDMTA